MKRSLLIAGAALILALSLGGAANAQTGKIGYIEEERIIQNYEAWRKAQEQFQTQLRAWEDEYNRMMQSYINDSLEFEKQKLILSAERKASRQAELKAKRGAAESYGKDILGPNGQAERENAQLTKPLLENVQAAISKVAQEGNYDVIFSSSALTYVNPALDITDKVIEALAQEG